MVKKIEWNVLLPCEICKIVVITKHFTIKNERPRPIFHSLISHFCLRNIAVCCLINEYDDDDDDDDDAGLIVQFNFYFVL